MGPQDAPSAGIGGMGQAHCGKTVPQVSWTHAMQGLKVKTNALTAAHRAME